MGSEMCIRDSLKSVELLKMTADSVTEAILETIDSFRLSREKLLTVLMDSCAIMHGSKSGVFQRLRGACPNLLDVNSDACRHANNMAKMFTKQLQGNIESLFYDIHSHFKYCVGQKEKYRQLCLILNLPMILPKGHCTTRWLSTYDCASVHAIHWT